MRPAARGISRSQTSKVVPAICSSEGWTAMYCSFKAGIISGVTDGGAAPPMAASAAATSGSNGGGPRHRFSPGKAHPPGRTDWTCIPEISLCTPHGIPAGSFPAWQG
jgi:hypothetical protein